MSAHDLDEVARKIGLRIAELRKGRGLTQQEFAELIPANVQWLSKVELGKQNLTLAMMIRLSNAFEMPVGDLFLPPKGVPKKSVPGRPPRERRTTKTGKS